MTPRTWRSHRWTGSAADFHAAELPHERGIWLCVPSAPALVIGSSQSVNDFNREAARAQGVDTPRRRTGGGAVWVHPDDSIWIDVLIPRDDPRWVDDIGESMQWLGRAWADALAPYAGGMELDVHRGRFDAGLWGAVVCFAGVAPGEVLATGPAAQEVTEPGRTTSAKLVGISQRRGRDGARFQCIAYRAWRPQQWTGLLANPSARQAVAEIPVACTSATAAQALQSLVDVLNSGNSG